MIIELDRLPWRVMLLVNGLAVGAYDPDLSADVGRFVLHPGEHLKKRGLNTVTLASFGKGARRTQLECSPMGLNHFREGVIVECRGNSQYDVNFNGIVEFNVPTFLLQDPRARDGSTEGVSKVWKVNDAEIAPMGLGTAKKIDIPKSVRDRHAVRLPPTTSLSRLTARPPRHPATLPP